MPRLLQHPAVLLLLCVSLAGTPVTYRGGATNPHPHMFFEFLLDAEAGAFDHHHHGDAADEENDGHETPEHHSSNQNAGTPQFADPAERFGASLSAFVVGDVGQLAFILPNSALPQSAQIDIAFAHRDRILSGISQSPTAPPPR